MNQPCRIRIQSSRGNTAFGFVPPIVDGEEEEWDEEEWDEEPDGEEMLLHAPLTSDAWVKKQEIPNLPPKSVTRLTSYGICSLEEDGSFRFSYEDSEITGLEGCLTTFCFSPSGMLVMLRRGPVKTCMVFEKGHRHLCDYGSELGFPSVSLHTHELDFSPTARGAEIRVGYSVDAGGSRAERNELTISVERVN
ncbi:MAG: DUF1934 domain-containing protein [Clostridia bacterium]|nr:DUF1934 domain-containing protein [Clostridia bacterium]